LNLNKDLPVPNCTAAQIDLPAFKRRKIQAQFSRGAITSDGGVLLLRTIDQQYQLTQWIAEQMRDPRDPDRIRHPVVDLLRQRVYALACGYEDLNAHAGRGSDQPAHSRRHCGRGRRLLIKPGNHPGPDGYHGVMRPIGGSLLV